MAFLVEDGSGIENANAYIDVAFADDYHSDRDHRFWSTLSDATKQASIIRSSEYVDKRFGRRFRGFRQMKSQGLEWPRLSAFDDDDYLFDDIPAQLKKAVAEYALRAAMCGVLVPDPITGIPHQSFNEEDTCEDRDVRTGSGELIRTRERVGPVEEEKWFASSASPSQNFGGARSVQSSLVSDFNIPEYPEADLWLEELIENSMVTSLVRA